MPQSEEPKGYKEIVYRLRVKRVPFILSHMLGKGMWGWVFQDYDWDRDGVGFVVRFRWTNSGMFFDTVSIKNQIKYLWLLFWSVKVKEPSK